MKLSGITSFLIFMTLFVAIPYLAFYTYMLNFQDDLCNSLQDNINDDTPYELYNVYLACHSDRQDTHAKVGFLLFSTMIMICMIFISLKIDGLMLQKKIKKNKK